MWSGAGHSGPQWQIQDLKKGVSKSVGKAHVAAVQLPRKRPLLNILQNGCSEASFPAFCSHLRLLRLTPSFSAVLYCTVLY